MGNTNGEGNANALKHGLRSRSTLIAGESVEEFEEFRESVLSDLMPEGGLEEELAERAVSCLWRLRRIAALECEVMDEAARKSQLPGLTQAQRWVDAAAKGYKDVSWAEQEGQRERAGVMKRLQTLELENVRESTTRSVGRGLLDPQVQAALTLLRRYETSLDRCLSSALARLERLQWARRGEEEDRVVVHPAPAGAAVRKPGSGSKRRPRNPIMPEGGYSPYLGSPSSPSGGGLPDDQLSPEVAAMFKAADRQERLRRMTGG